MGRWEWGEWGKGGGEMCVLTVVGAGLTSRGDGKAVGGGSKHHLLVGPRLAVQLNVRHGAPQSLPDRGRAVAANAGRGGVGAGDCDDVAKGHPVDEELNHGRALGGWVVGCGCGLVFFFS